MKFASSYEPNQYESDIYAAWEAAGVFDPKLTTKPVDDDGDGIDDRLEGEPGNALSRSIFGDNRKEPGKAESELRGAFATTGAIDEASPVTTGASEEARRK